MEGLSKGLYLWIMVGFGRTIGLSHCMFGSLIESISQHLEREVLKMQIKTCDRWKELQQ